ncbi:MAG: hypothetical protein ABJA02_03000 [Acidobacteriota bacterium]
MRIVPNPKQISLALVILAAMLSITCGSKNEVNPRLSAEMPNKIIWAWERPEDLRFLDPHEFGVAFLAQTLYLEGDQVTVRKRRVPVETAPGTYMIAVTRIETNKETAKRPTLSADMSAKTISLIKSTLDLPEVRAVQIDFDAVKSEREFYRTMMKELRHTLDKVADKSVRTPLTMTALASWCTGDAWFNDFPVDEAVPMAFQMGADESKIKTYLGNGNDWVEPLCRGSYGISIEEGRIAGMKDERRVYYFKSSGWAQSDPENLIK